MKDRLFFLGFCISLTLMLGACVTNKKFTLVQSGQPNERKSPTDSVLRHYATIDSGYRIQPEDIISVRYETITAKDFDFLNLDREQGRNTAMTPGNALLMGELVDKNGAIPIPYFGKVKVAGLTVFELQDKLTALIEGYVEKPIVKVRLLNYRFTVLGEVNKEGTITLTNNRVNLLEAIGLAGGFTDLADRSHVKLIRHRNGIVEVQYLDLLDEEFFMSPYYYVNQGDILIVTPLRQRPFRKYFGPNLALGASVLSVLLFATNLILLNNSSN